LLAKNALLRESHRVAIVTQLFRPKRVRYYL
jgi:hypothetical protein